MATDRIRWGIIGCGRIAHAFAEGLALVPKAELTAGASRTPGKAAEFAARYPSMRAYTDYESLVKGPEVDAVYVSTTHNFHHQNVLLALSHGKHVLCEKPITINASQLEELIATAKANNCFLMEALWTRFLPGIIKLKELLASGVIGEPRVVSAFFGIDRDDDPEHRLMNPKLAGGAVLDLGIYPLNFAHIVFGGAPEASASLAWLGRTGVDEISSCLLRFPDGRMAMLTSTCKVAEIDEATIYGKKGRIRVEKFLRPVAIHVEIESGTQTFDVRYPSSGFQYEIEEATNCILDGRTESAVMPLSESLAIIRLMDRFRSEWGLTYPEER